jgi:hypothetical protein
LRHPTQSSEKAMICLAAEPRGQQNVRKPQEIPTVLPPTPRPADACVEFFVQCSRIPGNG